MGTLQRIRAPRPLVSVVVTSYNNGKYLVRCLEALRKQTLQNIEIICIDDASVDGSVEILRRFVAEDDRVRLILNRRNMGPSPSAARNKAMKHARAPMVMFCDGDDYYEATMCEKMYYAIIESDADLAMSEITVTYEANAEMKQSDSQYYSLAFRGMQNITDEIICKMDFAPTNKIFRKKLLRKYRIKFPKGLYYEDAYFALAYLSVSEKIYFLNEKLYHYIRHKNSIMAQTWSNGQVNNLAIDHLYIVEKWFDFLKKWRLLGKYNSLYWRIFERYLWLAIEHSKTPSQIEMAKAEATSFVKRNQTWFDFETKEIRDKIYQLKDAPTPGLDS